VKRDTHERLISDDQAQLLLEQLARRSVKRSQKAKHDYLLAGLLTTPAGKVWHGIDREFYRHGKGGRILARRVDRTVVDCLTEDLAGGRLAGALLEHMRARLLEPVSAKRLAGLRRSLEAIDTRIRRLAELAAEAQTAAPLLRTMGEKEKERDQVAGELEQLEREAATQRSLGAITEDQVVDALRAIAVDIAAGKDVPGLRDQIMRLLERVELDPEQPGEVVLHYRLPAIGGLTGVSMASPQGFERYPGGRRGCARAPGEAGRHRGRDERREEEEVQLHHRHGTAPALRCASIACQASWQPAPGDGGFLIRSSRRFTWPPCACRSGFSCSSAAPVCATTAAAVARVASTPALHARRPSASTLAWSIAATSWTRTLSVSARASNTRERSHSAQLVSARIVAAMVSAATSSAWIRAVPPVKKSRRAPI
jgi:hypothetical protein